MQIDLSSLDVHFSAKPLLIGGKAMEYYGIRKSGHDIDFVVMESDYRSLARQYPNNKKDLFGDLGVVKDGFEIWQSICLYKYNFLSRDAIELENYKVASLEMLLFLKALGMHKEKYRKDAEMIVKKIFEVKYKDQKIIE